MCSICGIIDFKNRENVSEENVMEMGKVLAHRGPDQQGLFTNNYVAFEHNRLAIMDIEKGLQPMTRNYKGKSCTIVYNGEIYNGPELRREIEGCGIKFQTNCDTEIVLYTYLVFGEACASKLNGIFVFAIWDNGLGKVYLARDRFGIKPLFYTQLGSMLLFASEVKSLLKHPKVEAKVDQTGLWQLLYLAPIKIIGTSVFKGIDEVEPAQHGYYSDKGLELKYYWQLEAKKNSETEKEIIEHTRELVKDAIQRQLVSDAPLCTFLSGGLDSSIISSVASRQYQQEGRVLSTYSFEYEGNKQNFHNTLFQPQSDDDFASYLAAELGTHHRILTAHNNEIVDLLFEAAKYRDLPGMADIDSSLLYYCKEVKKNHTVALSGECADEIFGGYPWFYREEMLQKEFFPWIHDPHKRIELFDEKQVRPVEGYNFVKEVYKKSLESCPLLESDNKAMKQSRQATWLSTRYFMTSLLERKDRMSMASGVEVRVPFADHRILEYIYNVPWEIKFKGQVEKALLREAMAEYLPDSILNRKKSPYPKTHNPKYEEAVIKLLNERLENPNSRLKEMVNKKALEELFRTDNVTWFGQLMSKPQLIAWLIQLDYWFDYYNINID